MQVMDNQHKLVFICIDKRDIYWLEHNNQSLYVLRLYMDELNQYKQHWM